MLESMRQRRGRGVARLVVGAAAVAGAVLFLVSEARLAAPPRPSPSPSPSADADSQYGNPPDLDQYIAELASPERDTWQKPDQVVAALGLTKGQTACDIGSGPGYFTLRLARAVGPSGFVYAVDVEARMLQALRERLDKAHARNVAPVLAVADDPLLPRGACDLILVVNTYHHFPDREAYLVRLRHSLKPKGRIVDIDYQRKPTPTGPPIDHRVARETFLAEAKSAGLSLLSEPSFLPYQYFLILHAK
jgi:SAM-dependent methyltransferase